MIAEASNDNPIELTILMPCLNEAETLATCIEKAQHFLERSGVVGEIVIADNGSTDGSQGIAHALGARVIDIETRGYGAALRGGIQAARGRFVIMGDSDDSYDFTQLDRFVAQLRKGYHLVMGNRFKGGIVPGAMPFMHKYLGNPALSWLGRLFFSSPIKDFHCGLRGFEKAAIVGLRLRTTGMEFASEMVVKATLQGLKITEVPTTLSLDGRSRPPHLRSWRDGWRHLRFLLMYAPQWLYLYPGLFLVALGLGVMLVVLPGPLHVGSVVFDVHTLMVAMGAVLVGSQTVLFFLIAKKFAASQRLLPESARFGAVSRRLSLEAFVVVGVLLLLLGLFGLVWAVVQWGQANFGDLDYSWMMRLVVPAVTSIAVGLELVLAGFLISLLDMHMAE